MTIVCHSRRFIFIKTYKTAGTSIEIALSRHCADSDVLTRLEEDEDLRARTTGRSVQNSHRPFAELRLQQRALHLLGKRYPKFVQHMSAARVRRAVGEKVWAAYFKFCVVRNPFDRLISRYYHAPHTNDDLAGRGVASFDQYLRYYPQTINENWALYTSGDALLVDDVARFENLGPDLERIGAAIGIGGALADDLASIRAKSQHRPPGARHFDLITPEQRATIEHLCRAEIERFGYGFDLAPALEWPPALEGRTA